MTLFGPGHKERSLKDLKAESAPPLPHSMPSMDRPGKVGAQRSSEGSSETTEISEFLQVSHGFTRCAARIEKAASTLSI